MVGWQRHLRSILRHATATTNRNQSHPNCAASYSSFAYSSQCPGSQLAGLRRVSGLDSGRISGSFSQYLQYSGFFSSRSLSADDASNMEPISSPLTPLLGDGKTTAKDATSKRLTVQAIAKGIKQSPKKVNLVAKLVRGMCVEDALLQLQVTVKRAAKTVYQVIHSARANAAHNHGLDPDRLLVAEAFVGKGLYLKRISYHSKGRSGIMMRPRCRLTVVVRETTPEEEAKIAKLRVSNYKKLTKTERQLVPHQLIESTPRWGRKRKESVASSA